MMEWLRYGKQYYPNRICMNNYTYQDIYSAVVNVATRLQTLSDTRIAIVSDNSVTMAVYLLAAMLVRKEVLLLNVHLTAGEIENQLCQLHITTVLHSAKRCGQVPKSVTSMEFESMESMLHNEEKDIFDWIVNDNDIAAIMNTSATTGQFKSVPLRWSQIKAHVQASQEVLGRSEQDNWLMVLPLFHVSGLSILMRSLYNGTAMTIMESYDEEQVLQCIHDGRINMMSLVPTILKNLEPRIIHHQLRVILLGGEFIPRPLVDACVEKQLPIYKTYGMTETFSQSVTMPVLLNLNKLDSVGKPLPGMTVHIVNPDVDGVGEIHLNGPMVMRGYINREPIHGDFNTDDMGYVDEDGFLYILNRRTDLIISGGENIYPKEIEDTVYAMQGVKECAVIPVADTKWGQVPALFVAFDDIDALGTDSKMIVRDYISSKLAKYKVPKYITIMDALPRNGTGKIMRKSLAAHLDMTASNGGSHE
ncbi:MULTISPECIES: o-succinylbenzoate--CoA ligase [unclassified Veillonella]|uniref:o-succinylbenzoate--CoA ligase n=1 Tax=Veillonella TaxID=29465 RepID=UPI00044E79BA|nr:MULTISPECIES: o-succinylbenzoate--CoA ligase [unclassified Veillonella]EUB24638.1 O-succinylbenzoate-CoA ligase [Veillonella sp. ICM51a]MDU3820236.1 o-succinylbenzoate--CoA ligase [Veillonella sp.]